MQHHAFSGVVTATLLLLMVLSVVPFTVEASVIPEIQPFGEPVDIDEVARAVVEPQNISVGDSERVNVTLIINITGANTLSPVADLEWTLAFPEAEYFRISGIKATAYYVDIEGNEYPLSTTVSTEATYAYIDFYIGSVDSENITIYVEASIPTTTKLSRLGTTINYGLAGNIGQTLVQSLGFANTTVYILHKPPELSAMIYPSVSGRGLGAPGTRFNITISAFDASGVYNVSVRIENSSGYVVSEWVLGSDVTGNATSFTYTITWDSTGYDEGNYTVVIESYDVLGMEPSIKNYTIELRRGYTIPIDFSKLSDALAYPGIKPGSTIYIESNITEESTLVVNKQLTIVGLGNVWISFSGVNVGFNITSPTRIANVGVKGAETIFNIVNVESPVSIEEVKAIGERFIRVVAPYIARYWNHTVRNSLLNGTPVAYVFGNATLEGSYEEIHLAFGNSSLINVSAAYTEVINSTVTINSSQISALRAVGSRIKGYNTEVSSWSGVNSTYKGYAEVHVRVLFQGVGVGDAEVRVSTGVGEASSRTGGNGLAILWAPVMVCNGGSCSVGYTGTVIAEKSGLRASATIDLHRPPVSITLTLPTPSLTLSVTNILGQAVTVLTPGMVVNVTVSYDLLTFNDVAYITVSLYGSKGEISSITMYVSGKGGVNAGFMVPYEEGEYSLKVTLSLKGLPVPLTLTWP